MNKEQCYKTTNGTNCLVQGLPPCLICQQFLANLNKELDKDLA